MLTKDERHSLKEAYESQRFRPVHCISDKRWQRINGYHKYIKPTMDRRLETKKHWFMCMQCQVQAMIKLAPQPFLVAYLEPMLSSSRVVRITRSFKYKGEYYTGKLGWAWRVYVWPRKLYPDTYPYHFASTRESYKELEHLLKLARGLK